MRTVKDKEKRQSDMSRIKGKNTKPEILVRKFLFANGFRFRIHVKDLPGKPDIVLPRYRTVIFVHGCFWHQHAGCIDCSNPKTNSKYWRPKLLANVRRDRKHRRRLRRTGWTPIVIWECQTRRQKELRDRLRRKLNPKSTT